MRARNILRALALVVSSVNAQTATYCPGSDVCFAVNVPALTASSGSGDIYFQITGPTSMSWLGLGQGTSMTGANIFMVYADAAGTNVTLSPRLGSGDTQPSSSTAAQVTLLEGSGISNGVMTANVRCSNCNSWSGGSMSFTDTSSNWIWAYLSGSSVASDSVDANLRQHSQYGTTSFNLESAAGGSSSNPFLASNTTTGSTTGQTPGNTNSGSTGTSQSDSTVVANYKPILKAHGILAPVAFVLLFPMGAMGIRMLNFNGLVYAHAGWMVLALTLAIVSMGLGIWLADVSNQIKTYHAIIGLVVVGSLLMQPISGLMHHILFKKYGRSPNTFTFPHLFWGRAMITLGIINGGLGLKLSNNTTGGKIAYAVVSAIMWTAWMVTIVVSMMRKRGNVQQRETGEELVAIRSNAEKDGGFQEQMMQSENSSPRHNTRQHPN